MSRAFGSSAKSNVTSHPRAPLRWLGPGFADTWQAAPRHQSLLRSWRTPNDPLTEAHETNWQNRTCGLLPVTIIFPHAERKLLAECFGSSISTAHSYDSAMNRQPQNPSHARYFDNAATSFPKPPAVIEAMSRHLTQSGAPARGTYTGARESARLVNKCRERIARLVNLTDSRGNPATNHVVFGHNTTDALNLAIKGVLGAARRRLGPGKALHIVTTVMEHNSILRPLHAARERDKEIEWTIVPANPKTGLVDPGDLRRAIRRADGGGTVLVCINHASNVMGVVQDMERIGSVCAEFGAGGDDPDGILLLLDGAQSLGHCAVDMRAMRVDLLAFPGHKGLMGPTGTGGLCIRPGVESRLDTIREGGTGSTSEQPSQPQSLPDKYEPGSHNTVGIIGLSEGVAWLLDQGIEHVREHEVELMHFMLGQLAPDATGVCTNAPGLRLLGPLDLSTRVGVCSFVHESLSSQEMAAILEASFGILTRAGLHCAPLVHEMLGTSPASNAGASGAIRLSLGPFLTIQDVQYACTALGAMCREQRPATSPEQSEGAGVVPNNARVQLARDSGNRGES